MNAASYLSDMTARFRELQKQCDGAIAQVPFEQWTRRLDPESNSIETLILHLSGNMRSRWSDFLTADGEKADRNRDSEFEDAGLSKDALLQRWNDGWKCLFGALESLTPDDVERTVTIRNQPHSVMEAIHRQLAHYGAHTGQLVFLAKHLAGPQWKTLSIPRHGSTDFNAKLMK